MSQPDLSLPALLAFVREDARLARRANFTNFAEAYDAIAERLTTLDEQEPYEPDTAVKRYDVHVKGGRDGSVYPDAFESADGIWVDYNDHARIVNAERQRAEHAERQRAALLTALKALVIDANRLCDRNLGGTYEEDCRRSIEAARAVIPNIKASSEPTAAPDEAPLQGLL